MIVVNVRCIGLAIDHQRHVYVSDAENDEVRRYTIGAKNGIVVAGRNGEGNQLNQLNFLTYFFVDEEKALYVSDWNNPREMKRSRGAKEDLLVTGGQGKGRTLTQLSSPRGLFADTSSTICVADSWSHGVTRLSIAV